MNGHEYLVAHGLDEKYVTSVWGWVVEEDKLIIPDYDENGQLHHVNQRNLGEGQPKYNAPEQGTHPYLYGIHKAIKEDAVVYCEGQADCVRLWQAGIPAVTDTAGVGKVKPEWAQHLKGKKVYLCLDNDVEGKKCIRKDYKVISEFASEVLIVELPEGVKDVCEFFLRFGSADEFKAMLEVSPTFDAWTIENAPEEFAVETISNLLKSDIPQEQWLIDKLVPISGLSVIAGEEATGKSFYALTMAQAISSGEPWLGHFPVNQKAKVLFIDKENERVIIQDRARGLGMDRCGDNIYRIVKPEGFTFNNLGMDEDRQDMYSKFARHIETFVRLYDIQLIILDSFIDFMAGDENSVRDCMDFLGALRALFPGRSILFLSHYTKPYKGVVRTPAQMISGSHAISAAITSGIAVTRGDANNEFLIQSIKPRNAVNDKSKHRVILHSTNDPKDQRKTLITQIEYCGVVDEDAVSINNALQIIEREVVEAGSEGLSRQDILAYCREAGISQRTADDAKKALIKSGRFETKKVGHSTYLVAVDELKIRGNYDN